MSDSPVFVCEFADGQVTRMSVHPDKNGKPDVERGVRLARCAYYSRKHEQPPAIKAARFEQDGALLESYSAVDLEDIEHRPIEDIDAKALHAERDAPVSPSWQTSDELADADGVEAVAMTERDGVNHPAHYNAGAVEAKAHYLRRFNKRSAMAAKNPARAFP